MHDYLIKMSQTLDPNQIQVPKPGLDQSAFQEVLTIVFGAAGAVAFLIIVIAGLKYVVSQGDPGATAKAKNAIIYAAIGLILSMLAFSIVRYVVRGTA